MHEKMHGKKNEWRKWRRWKTKFHIYSIFIHSRNCIFAQHNKTCRKPESSSSLHNSKELNKDRNIEKLKGTEDNINWKVLKTFFILLVMHPFQYSILMFLFIHSCSLQLLFCMIFHCFSSMICCRAVLFLPRFYCSYFKIRRCTLLLILSRGLFRILWEIFYVTLVELSDRRLRISCWL